jgi:hypothetical protein
VWRSKLSETQQKSSWSGNCFWGQWRTIYSLYLLDEIEIDAEKGANQIIRVFAAKLNFGR